MKDMKSLYAFREQRFGHHRDRIALFSRIRPRCVSGTLQTSACKSHREPPAKRHDCSSLYRFFQNRLPFLNVSTMRQTEVTAPAFSPVPAPTFTAAAIRFVASLAALISVSLLLAGL
jgi:hypothetical protein